MKLTYRGIPYELNSLSVPTTKTATTATYRGQTYSIQQPALDLPISHPAGITYRLSSGFCFNGTFLGRRYHCCPLVIQPIGG